MEKEEKCGGELRRGRKVLVSKPAAAAKIHTTSNTDKKSRITKPGSRCNAATGPLSLLMRLNNMVEENKKNKEVLNSKGGLSLETDSFSGNKSRITKHDHVNAVNCPYSLRTRLKRMVEENKKNKQVPTSVGEPLLETNSTDSFSARELGSSHIHKQLQMCSSSSQTSSSSNQTNSSSSQTSTSQPVNEPSQSPAQSFPCHQRVQESPDFVHSKQTPVSTSARKGRGRPGRTRKLSRNGRGRSKGLTLARYLETGGKKPVITFPPGKSRPLCSWGKEFLTEVGIILRKLAPLTCLNWTAVPEIHKELIRNRILEKFQFDFSIVHQMVGIEKYMRNLFRQYKNRSHSWYINHGGRKGGRKHPYDNMALDTWVMLCDHFDTPKFIERSEKNKKNRSKLLVNHKSGSKAFVRLFDEMAQRDGKEQDPMVFFKTTRFREESGTWVTPRCEELHAEMVQLLSQPTTDGKGMISPNEAFEQVIGRSGYKIGLGHGEQPKATRCANVDTVDIVKRAEKAEATVAELQEEVVVLRTKQEAHSTEVEQLRAQYQSMEAMVQNLMSRLPRSRRR